MNPSTKLRLTAKNFTRNFFLILAFLSVSFVSANAQSRLHGKIADSTGQPIAYANVLLLNSSDSVLVKGILTTETGSYIFQNINPGSYIISATHMGCKNFYQPC